MIELARPAFLWAGAALAGVAVLLHLLRPRERVPKPLPTSRFLTSDPRRRIRIRRRPDEILLLLLRMAICASIGAAFAGARWIGPADGSTTIVVVDAGAATRPLWEAVRELAAPERADDRLDLALVRPGEGGVPTLVRLGSDLPDEARWTALAPDADAGEVRLGHLLRALRDVAARSTGADSLAARIVTVPGWGAWGPGVRELRDSLWPGRIELVVAGAPPDSDGAVRSTIAVQAEAPLRAAVAAALGVLGLQTDTAVSDDGAGAALITLRVGREESLGPLWTPAPSEPQDAPGGTARAGSAFADAFMLLDGRVLPGAGMPPRGTPAPASTVPLLRVGGRAAAAARRIARGCEVALPLEADAPILGSGDLAVLLEALLREGCGVPEVAGAEEAWRALLGPDAQPEEAGAAPGSSEPAGAAPGSSEPAGAESGRPRRVAAAEVRGTRAGVPLTRWLLALAVAMAAAEIRITRRMDDRRSRSTPERS